MLKIVYYTYVHEKFSDLYK